MQNFECSKAVVIGVEFKSSMTEITGHHLGRRETEAALFGQVGFRTIIEKRIEFPFSVAYCLACGVCVRLQLRIIRQCCASELPQLDYQRDTPQELIPET